MSRPMVWLGIDVSAMGPIKSEALNWILKPLMALP